MRKFKAFSLLEVAISLTIIGIITMSIVKGLQLLHDAKLEKTTSQIENIKIAIENFKNTYNQIPGDYSGFAFGNSNQGNDNGIIDENEEKFFWEHLEQAELINKKQRSPIIGGIFTVKNYEGQNFIIFSGPKGKPFLSLKDALKIKNKIDGTIELNYGSVKLVTTKFIKDNELDHNQKYNLYIEFP